MFFDDIVDKIVNLIDEDERKNGYVDKDGANDAEAVPKGFPAVNFGAVKNAQEGGRSAVNGGVN